VVKRKVGKLAYNANTNIEIKDNNTLIPFNLEPVPSCVLMTGAVGKTEVVSVVSVAKPVKENFVVVKKAPAEREPSVVEWRDPLPEIVLLTPEENSAAPVLNGDDKTVLPVAAVANG
jgi:hypothetical protein